MAFRMQDAQRRKVHGGARLALSSAPASSGSSSASSRKCRCRPWCSRTSARTRRSLSRSCAAACAMAQHMRWRSTRCCGGKVDAAKQAVATRALVQRLRMTPCSLPAKSLPHCSAARAIPPWRLARLHAALAPLVWAATCAWLLLLLPLSLLQAAALHLAEHHPSFMPLSLSCKQVRDRLAGVECAKSSRAAGSMIISVDSRLPLSREQLHLNCVLREARLQKGPNSSSSSLLLRTWQNISCGDSRKKVVGRRLAQRVRDVRISNPRLCGKRYVGHNSSWLELCRTCGAAQPRRPARTARTAVRAGRKQLCAGGGRLWN